MNTSVLQNEVSCFPEFYEGLYRSEGKMDINKATFFEYLNLPKLSEENMMDLEHPITLEELNNTIKLLPNGKTPGIDGMPRKFYKKFAEELIPEFLKTFDAATDIGQIPPSMTESIITLILKKGKDPLECGRYWPISLLCCDGKLFTKLFTMRINNVIMTIIHPDQVGFVKGRTSSDSLLHLICKAKDLDSPIAVLSLDAEKVIVLAGAILFSLLKNLDLDLCFRML